MPWRETSVMEERLRFVARLLEGEGMSDVCREFGISRKTGYKIFNRYKDEGLEALTDRSRRPVRYANQVARAGRGCDPALQEGQAALGCAQDPRAVGQEACRRRACARQKHGACHSRPARAGRSCPQAATSPSRRSGLVTGAHAERSLVRRLQGRVQAWRWSLLLPADSYRRGLAFPSRLRSLRIDARTGCLRRLPPAVCPARPAGRDQKR